MKLWVVERRFDADGYVQNYTSKGGGICIAFTDSFSGWVHDCQVEGNYGFRGGGVYASASVLIEDCSLSGNTAWGYGGGANHGGAPFVLRDSNNDGVAEANYDPHACIRNCVIMGNACSWPGAHSGEGGGLALTTGDNGVLVFNNEILANEARLRGGGGVAAQ